MMTKPLLIYLVMNDGYFLSHRLPMVRAAQQAGFDVAVIAPVTRHRAAIEAAGVRVIEAPMNRRSLNFLRAWADIRRIEDIYRHEKPAIVHHIAMKPVLFGSVAAGRAGVGRVVNAFAGLGYVFTAQDLRARVLRAALIPAFRRVLKRPGRWLLLQNDDDRALLERWGLAPPGRTVVIRGSGVDLDHCPALPPPGASGGIICVFAGRMIGIKGLGALRQAFKLLEKTDPHIRLWLCGAPDPGNPGSWTEEQLRQWVSNSNNVIYKEHIEDMRTVWAQAHIALQPSLGGEGIPKSLLEAAACARPLIASDVPGCRDIVSNGDNGYLVPPGDAAALAKAIGRLASDPGNCAAMGQASRRLVEQRGLSAAAVTRQTLELYRAVEKDVK